MAWQSLAEDLEEEFSGLQRYEPGPPEAVKALRKAPPPDPRRAALEAAATALLRAAEAPAREARAQERLERQRARVAAWGREHRAEKTERQRARRAAKRAEDAPPRPGVGLESPLTRKRRKEREWRAGPGRERDLEAKRRWAAANREKRAAYERERRKTLTAGTG